MLVSSVRSRYRAYASRCPRSPKATNFRGQYSWPDFTIRFIGVWDTVGALGIPGPMFRCWDKEYYEFHDVALSTHVALAYQALAVDEHREPFLPAVWKQMARCCGCGVGSSVRGWFWIRRAHQSATPEDNSMTRWRSTTALLAMGHAAWERQARRSRRRPPVRR